MLAEACLDKLKGHTSERLFALPRKGQAVWPVPQEKERESGYCRTGAFLCSQRRGERGQAKLHTPSAEGGLSVLHIGSRITALPMISCYEGVYSRIVPAQT